MVSACRSNIPRTLLIAVCCVALLMHVSCRAVQPTQTPAEPTFTQTYVFSCGKKFNFIARIEDDKAWLFLPGETIETFKVTDNLYRSLEGSLQLDGEKGSLKSFQGNYEDCRNNRRQAIWENAKLNGADFRALGNEPGWNLEIRNQSKIVFVNNYDSERYEFDLPTPVTDTTARSTQYIIDQAGQELSLTILGETCSDSMSGERFESKVEVVFNGQTLHGCGRALH